MDPSPHRHPHLGRPTRDTRRPPSPPDRSQIELKQRARTIGDVGR
jgi:hypothetical protein